MEEPNYWKRLARRRVSRRQLLGAGAVAALGTATAAVVGCGGGGEKQPGQTPTPRGSPVAAGTPRAGGDITWGLGVGITGIDPHIDIPGLFIVPYLYSYLYSWRPSVEQAVTNNLVESMEIVDPLHFNFTLRKGVMTWPGDWAGAGEEMTSEDCVASFERRGTAITAPDKRFPQRIDRFDTPDPYTFNIVMKRAFVPAIREMANATWAIIPKKAIEANPGGFSQKAFGSGPFMLEEFRGAERIVLKKHPDYFLSPRPWLDGINFIVITENSSLIAAFRSGQHDVNGATLAKSDAEDLESEPDKYSVLKAPSLFYPVIHMKMRPPFNDPRVRQAIDLALNRDEFIAVIGQGEGNYNGPIQWPQVKWALPQDELRSFYVHDPDRAKALLAEAGQGGGFTAKMKLPKLTGPSIVGDTAVLIKDQLSRVGINFELDEVELGAFIGSTLLPGNFDVAFFPNLPYDEPDRPLSFYHSKGVSGTGNWNSYSNPELDKLIDAQSEEFDEAKRKDLILQAQRLILTEHGPQITLTGGFGYQARWNYAHFGTVASDGGEEQDPNAGPFGADIWVDRD